MNYEHPYTHCNLSVNHPTWKKYIVVSKFVENLRVKDKRSIFQLMRLKEDVNEDTFFPFYGFTAGEFATWQVLKDTARKQVKGKEKKLEESESVNYEDDI